MVSGNTRFIENPVLFGKQRYGKVEEDTLTLYLECKIHQGVHFYVFYYLEIPQNLGQ